MEEKFNEMKKKCPMFIKPDLFLIGEVLLILVIALFVVASKEKIGTEKSRKNFLIYGGFGSLVACYIAQGLCGKAKVKNKLGSDIEYLEEGGGKYRPAYLLGSGKEMYDIDGVRFNNTVYKIPDGVHVTVNKNGNVLPHSLLGSLLYFSEGGLKTKSPGDGWETFFPELERVQSDKVKHI